MVKEFLSNSGIHYTTRNINEDSSALAEFIELGASLPPVVVYGDRWVAGFDPDALEDLLRDLL